MNKSPGAHARDLLKACGIAFAVACAPLSTTQADDTDVYIDNDRGTTTFSQPMIMFSIDYNPNLNSTICSDAQDFTTRDPVTGAIIHQGCDASTFFLEHGLKENLPPSGPLSFFDIIRLSLRVVLRETAGYKAGLMLNHNQGAGACTGPGTGKCTNGGYMARRFRSIGTVVPEGTPDTDVSRVELLKVLDALPPVQGNLSHPYQGAELFYEFFRYLTGQQVYNGSNGFTDYATDNNDNLCLRNFDGTTFSCAAGTDSILAGRDTQAATSGASGERLYLSPLLEADACTKIFTINFIFQTSIADDQSRSDMSKGRTEGGLGISVPANNTFDTTVGFLNDTDLAPETNPFNSKLAFTFLDDKGTADTTDDQTVTLNHLPGTQNVTSFFIARPTPEPTEKQEAEPTYQYTYDLTTETYAKLGGTNSPLPLSRDPEKLVAAIRNAITQILSVSATFVAASVPVNVFNRAEIVDNVYFALFQAEKGPRWNGNLKKFKLEARDIKDADGNVVGKRAEIVDFFRNPAISQTDGRIQNSARSFWTDAAGARLDAGDVNGDGTVDTKDTTGGDGIADNLDPEGNIIFPTPGGGTAANPPLMISNADGRFVSRGGAGAQCPGFKAGTSGPGTTNPAETNVNYPDGPRKLYYLTMSDASASLKPLNVGLNSSEIKAQLGDATLDDATTETLIRFARGQDVSDIDQDKNTTESRFWIVGDPLHSRPLPVSYGIQNGTSGAPAIGHAENPTGTNQTDNPAIFLAMAGNDGAMHFFRNTGGGPKATAAELGQEVWSFMPPEGLAQQLRLLQNVGGEPLHPYSVDGDPTALILDNDADGNIEPAFNDRVILYFGLRRGQSRYNALKPEAPLAAPVSAYYALDITNPMTPKFLWRITPQDRTTSAGVDATTDFAELAMTFSRPRVGTVVVGKTNPPAPATPQSIRQLAVFFGGGYNGGYEYNADGSVLMDSFNEPTRIGKDRDGVMEDDAVGNAIFIAKANNAELIWKVVGKGSSATNSAKVLVADGSDPTHLPLLDSIPSNLTLIDSDADGASDRIYVGDLGGNLWRVDMGPVDTDPLNLVYTDDWTFTRLACLGRHGGTDCAEVTDLRHDRRFFHEPDVVQATDGSGRFDAVIIGSGDRENPIDQGPYALNSETPPKPFRTYIDVDNELYMVKDRNIKIGAKDASTVRDRGDLFPITTVCTDAAPCAIGAEGWRLALEQPNGEKALSAPLTIGNSIFFTTYLPAPPPSASTKTLNCAPREGGGFLYAIDLLDASPTYNYDHDGGDENQEGTTASDRIKDLNTPGIPAQVVFLGDSNALPGGSKGPSSGGGCDLNVMAGARIFNAPGCPRFKTFWQRVGS